MKINLENLRVVLTDLRNHLIPLCNVGDEGLNREDITEIVELLIELLEE